ncbi:MAG: DUF1028 domain-containing protein [Planctomycetaceae bacterium]|nr:DUF1028 domain-containing protein [Planctomycetaceae bacterium]
MSRARLMFFACPTLLAVLSCGVFAEEVQPDFGVSATFSIVAVDPSTGECGAAVASKYPAVGKVVPYVRAGVGAFCTQHWHNPSWGERALDLLAAGHGSEEVLGILLADDARRDKRQLAIIDMKGRAANRNPTDADASGEYWGAMSGKFFACQGNTLAGRQVVVAMAEAFEETDGSLADRLLAALLAADQAGGDHRGRLAAGIRIAKTGHDGNWFELDVDQSDDAVTDLYRKYLSVEHEAKGDWSIRVANVSPPSHPKLPEVSLELARDAEVREVTEVMRVFSTQETQRAPGPTRLFSRLRRFLARCAVGNGPPSSPLPANSKR